MSVCKILNAFSPQTNVTYIHFLLLYSTLPETDRHSIWSKTNRILKGEIMPHEEKYMRKKGKSGHTKCG